MLYLRLFKIVSVQLECNENTSKIGKSCCVTASTNRFNKTYIFTDSWKLQKIEAKCIAEIHRNNWNPGSWVSWHFVSCMLNFGVKSYYRTRLYIVLVNSIFGIIYSVTHCEVFVIIYEPCVLQRESVLVSQDNFIFFLTSPPNR